MPIKVSDPILGRSRGQPTTAKTRYVNTPRVSFLNDYIDTVFTLCGSDDMPDAAIVVAQADVETGGFTSHWWVTRGNPAGLGVTGDPTQNAASKTFATGRESARAHVAHLLLYATGKIDRGGLVPADDPRYNAYRSAYGATAKASTLQGLANAWDVAQPTYATIIANRGNAIFPDLPNAVIVATPLGETWRQIFTRMFGPTWRVTQAWKNDPPGPQYDNLYSYGAGHGLDGQQHPGIDVGIAYDTTLRAPFAATVVCAATNKGSGAYGNQGCGAFNDWGEGSPADHPNGPEGIGRIELFYPEINASLIYGHSRQSFVQPNEAVDKDERIGTSGGMYGAHIHLEGHRWANAKMTIVDPVDILEELAQRGMQPTKTTPLPAPPVTPPSTTPPPVVVSATTPQTIDYSSLPFPVYQQWPTRIQAPTRPGIKQKPKNVTVHETANTRPGANAKMHANWMPGSTISVHFFVDDKVAYQTLPLNEVSFNAGCGDCDGNYAAVSIETCVNSDADLAKARDNVAQLVALLLKHLGLPLSSLRKHQDWSGKWCPAIMLSGAIWPSFTQKVAAYHGGAVGAPLPPSGYAQTYSVTYEDGSLWKGERNITVNTTNFLANPRTVTITGDGGYIRQFAGVVSPEVAKPVSSGDRVRVYGWVNGEAVDKELRWWITENYGRMWTGLSQEKPETVVGTTPPPTEAGDGSDTIDIPNVPEIKIINGIRFYPVGMNGETKKVTLTKDAASRQWASDEANVVQSLKRDDVVEVSYWLSGKNLDGEDHYWVLTKDESRLWIGHTLEFPGDFYRK